ncbi:MAG: hypothetical protein ABJG47_01140 [Ekhidna sp.]
MRIFKQKKEMNYDSLSDTLLSILNTHSSRKRNALIRHAIFLNDKMQAEIRKLNRQLAKERDFKHRIMESIKETLKINVDLPSRD